MNYAATGDVKSSAAMFNTGYGAGESVRDIPRKQTVKSREKDFESYIEQWRTQHPEIDSAEALEDKLTNLREMDRDDVEDLGDHELEMYDAMKRMEKVYKHVGASDAKEKMFETVGKYGNKKF